MGWLEDAGNWLFGQNSVWHSVTKGVGDLWNDVTGVTEQNRMAQEAAQRQMDFQERMSSTAYQRQMQDMKMAGINPIQAANSGGASAPSGASYVPQRANPVEGVAKLLAMTQGVIEMGLQTKQTNASVSNLQADSDLKRANAILSAAQANSVNAQSAKNKFTEPLFETGTGLIKSLLDEIKKSYNNGAKKIPKQIDDHVQKGINSAQNILQKIGLESNGKGGFKFKRTPKDIYGGTN